MTTTAEPTTVEGPGLYPDLPAEEYHADPFRDRGGSLSSTGARKLVPPSCPALFRHWADTRQPPKQVFEFGTAAHKLVLGPGPALARLDVDAYTTKDAKAKRDKARAEGKIPLKVAEHEQLDGMVAALRAHPYVPALFDPVNGSPEQSLFWTDEQTGVMRRARLDWLPTLGPGRLIVADYKTCVKADDVSIARAVDEHGYHQQADWYLSGLRALGLADGETAFVFVFQEKTPPYLINVVELDIVALHIGAAKNRRALQTYAKCTTDGVWPAWNDDVRLLPLPAYAERRDTEEYLT
ncbi:PD-(D/E)XK nuclease-like domain-containing protein [Streptomyces sp. NPDC088732]|uniref:PD-(D/E)XK nuclease-like domain-containing protein n=1 Tax=Streptomyces sp. NPDC088732 TaxID=3365879 RepID=UPI0037FAA52F